MKKKVDAMKVFRFVLYGLLLLAAGLAGFIIGLLSLGDYSPNMLLEFISGETPQAKITRYLQAVEAQDRAAALDAWLLPPENSGNFKQLSERRELVTDELLARNITHFMIFEPQWWGTCCDPGITSHQRNAGGARVSVQVLDSEGQPWSYTFDVFVNGPYFGDAIGNPYRHWFLRDVYPRGEFPIFWKLLYEGEVYAP